MPQPNLSFPSSRIFLKLGLVTLGVFILVGFYIFSSLSPLHQNLEIPLTSDSQLPIVIDLKNVFRSSLRRYEYQPVPATLGKIFSDNHDWVATLSANRITRLIATGDIIPARSVNAKTIQYQDFTWVFKQIGPRIASGDITLINLETPLIANCPITNEGMTFCGDKRHIEGLLLAGVDIAGLANNHLANYGRVGIEETTSVLKENGIKTTGVKQPLYFPQNGLTWAFLSYDLIGPRHPDIAWAEPERMKQDISQARTQADVVIVAISWGVEYSTQPTEQQIELGHLAIDAGADLILGNHPHWIQPVEIYHNKLIMYAHGNTVFDQMWSQETRTGVVGQYTFYDEQLVDVEFWPLFIEDYGQARWLEGDEGREVLERLQSSSRQLIANP